ncbi:mitochondrial import receptor subunit TOM6 homolog [Centrocercus urophasianus]|uniref:mitochondrial import receptor subunit TOM6 homolog n=1 Tax=Centrocercus urophasianus TaxID=9002 RepID=UPI001C64CE9A|nr:mitochondrial import receptor subunit TOM6 homolog [Centrocercus urophasianus]XP_042740227.1 mitochondrial import receptor subunit TOM6 homolog [Lagopus leucura]XP_052553974.1 mitochondrial import receptor subunit TOM6 homolog [Tympanuchus pallidicinctus]XP_052553975.1 mitochondrial import receptor subunit TOM6 homolog [Tympanuchus pallidicinctus]
MAAGGAQAGGSAASSPQPRPPPPQGPGGWLRAAYRFAADRNDFRRNLLVNVGLFAAGVWVARNLADIDLMAPQPVA